MLIGLFLVGDYRYGFQGQEKDDEVKGEGNSINYKYRMHDPRIGRFFAVHPLAPKYPHYTPYQFSGNKVIAFRELEGLEEFQSTESIDVYNEGREDGDKIELTDGSNGVWLNSDRVDREDRWKAAMEFATKQKDISLFKSYYSYDGESKERSYSFKIVRDYYLWVQGEAESKGFRTQWAKGAAYLVDELADTYESTDNSGSSVMTGGLAPSLGVLMKELNLGIAEFALSRFKSILYGSEGSSVEDWYTWDSNFIWNEQVSTVAPKIYPNYKGTKALNQMNSLSRKEGLWVFAKSKHFFPSFANFGVDLTDENFGAKGRYHIPMMMLYPAEHWQRSKSFHLMNFTVRKDRIIYESLKANKSINLYYENNKIR